MDHLNLSGLPFASRSASGNDNFIHDHDFIEIFFITEGEIVHNILNSSKKLFEGDGVLIAPSVPHYFSRSHSCIHRDNMVSVELFKDCCSFLNCDLYDELCTKKYVEFSITTDQIKFYEKSVISFLNSGNANQMKKQERFLALLLLGFIVFPDYYDNMALNDSMSERHSREFHEAERDRTDVRTHTAEQVVSVQKIKGRIRGIHDGLYKRTTDKARGVSSHGHGLHSSAYM